MVKTKKIISERDHHHFNWESFALGFCNVEIRMKQNPRWERKRKVMTIPYLPLPVSTQTTRPHAVMPVCSVNTDSVSDVEARRCARYQSTRVRVILLLTKIAKLTNGFIPIPQNICLFESSHGRKCLGQESFVHLGSRCQQLLPAAAPLLRNKSPDQDDHQVKQHGN